MHYLVLLVLFAQTTPATELPPLPANVDDLYQYTIFRPVDGSFFRDNRCRDGLQFPLFDVFDGDSHKVQQYLPLRPLEGSIPTEHLHTPAPQSQRGPVDDPVKARRECEDADPWPVVTAIT